MKASELRIGNYLNGRKGPVTVTEIRENNRVKIKENPSNFTVGDCLLPIPLTEEWLLKLGFEEKNIGNKLPESWYELKYLSNEHEPMITSWVSILINIETWSCVICDEYPDEIGANTKIKIEYVHQLQNLYFALTGEELTLQP